MGLLKIKDMGFIGKLLGGGLKTIADVAEKFIDTPDKKKKFQLEMKRLEMEVTTQAEETYQVELKTRSEIIKAEMEHGNNYTKNARPTIVYMGLIFTAIVYVIIPSIAYFTGTPSDQMPDIQLPSEFWWAWGTVVSVYGIGRSAEKYGIKNKVTSLITGS